MTPSSSYSDQPLRGRIGLISFSHTSLPTRSRIHCLCLQHQSRCQSRSTTITATTWCRLPYIPRELIREPPYGWIFLPPPLTLYSPPSSQREPDESDQQLSSLLKTFQQVPSQPRSQRPPLRYVPLWSSRPDCISHTAFLLFLGRDRQLGSCQWLPPFLCICTQIPPSGPRYAAISC